MIFYGTNSTHLKSEAIIAEKCPACQSSGSVGVTVFGKYAHLYWIPTFPMKKMAVAMCGNCQREISENEMSTNLQQAVQEIRAEAKTPIWHFSGLMVIGALILLIWNISSGNSKENGEFLANPMPGDRYEIKSGAGEYTTFKIKEITADSVFVLTNQMAVNKMTGIHKIDKSENYMDIGEGFSKKDLAEWFASGKIYDIER